VRHNVATNGLGAILGEAHSVCFKKSITEDQGSE
jgi:hypothetical protein